MLPMTFVIRSATQILRSLLRIVQQDKAYFSKVGVPCQYDFSVTFKYFQKVQRLREKLLQASTILESSLDIAYRHVSCHSDNSAHETDDLDAYTHQLRSHQRAVARHLKSSSGVLKTVCIP